MWVMASDALATIFALNPTEVRDLLDGCAGRLLADDMSFIEGGLTSAEVKRCPHLLISSRER